MGLPTSIPGFISESAVFLKALLASSMHLCMTVSICFSLHLNMCGGHHLDYARLWQQKCSPRIDGNGVLQICLHCINALIKNIDDEVMIFIGNFKTKIFIFLIFCSKADKHCCLCLYIYVGKFFPVLWRFLHGFL